MTANLQILVDSVDEGMLILSPEGVVRLANRAAGRYFPVVLGKRLPADEVMAVVLSVTRGYARPPLEFEADGPEQGGGRDRLRLKLLDSPLGGGYLIIIRNVSEEARYEHIVSNFANLVAVELAEPMAALRERMAAAVEALAPEDGERRRQLTGEAAEAAALSAEVSSRLAQLATFAQVFAKSPILASERIPVMELVSALLGRARPLLARRGIRFDASVQGQEMPVVYGSRAWLVEALYGYIEHMLKHCDVRSDMELIVRPFGNYVSLQIRNHGHALPRHADSAAFKPFAQAAARAAGQGGGPGDGLSLGLALCKHVVELHRGSMKFNEESGDITAFVLELPAGAPSESVNPDLGAEQARRYAEDLSRLMQRQRQAKPA